MNQKLKEDLLPIGSIVKLFQGNKYLMVMGRFHRNLEDGKIFDYAGCLYPEGYQGGNSYYLFQHQQIEQIIFGGLQNEEELAYRQLMFSQLEQLK